MAGALYQHSLPILIAVVAVIQIGALVLILATLHVADRSDAVWLRCIDGRGAAGRPTHTGAPSRRFSASTCPG